MTTRTTVSAVIAALGDSMDYAIPDHSFSPFYSDIGLGFVEPQSGDGEAAGIDSLYLHYNRATTRFGAPFVRFVSDEPLVEVKRTALCVEHRFASGGVRTAFTARNTFLVSCTGIDGIAFRFATAGTLPGEARVTFRDGCYLFEGYLQKADQRDPDPVFPIIVGLRVVRGNVSGDGVKDAMHVSPDDGTIVVAFSVNVLDIDRRDILRLLTGTPTDVDDAVEMTRAWLETTLGKLDVSPLGLTDDATAEEHILARAAYSMAANCTLAPGMLRGRVALWPARGSYPIIAPWDACFHTLGLAYMEPRLAPDQIFILTENGIRADGKHACFIASTWRRPELAQPALAGWAAERLYNDRKDDPEYGVAFVRRVLPGLILNNRWWLGHRMTRYGVISCPHGVESGWDNSPRWDRRPILATDMNTWLLMQLRVTERFARLVGDEKAAADARGDADALAAAMMDVLYDPEANRFRDVLVETGEPVEVLTPAAILPLLGDVGLDGSRARRMIEDTLLDPKRLFGEYPFPSVAYDESTYVSHDYWRGPVWMAVGWMMLEILDKYGYRAERMEAAKRLYRMVIRDGGLREWFDSTDGHGCGAHEQGWTAAILLRLRMELGSAE